MPVVTIHAAKTNLSKLIERACAGEEIIIARGDRPVVKLVPVGVSEPVRDPGTYTGQFTVPPEFFEPVDEDELKRWTGDE